MSDFEKVDPQKVGHSEDASNSSQQDVDHLIDPDAGLSDEERKKNVRFASLISRAAVYTLPLQSCRF